MSIQCSRKHVPVRVGIGFWFCTCLTGVSEDLLGTMERLVPIAQKEGANLRGRWCG